MLGGEKNEKSRKQTKHKPDQPIGSPETVALVLRTACGEEVQLRCVSVTWLGAVTMLILVAPLMCSNITAIKYKKVAHGKNKFVTLAAKNVTN